MIDESNCDNSHKNMESSQASDLMLVEVQVNSVVPSDRGILLSPESTPQKSIKRKSHEDLQSTPAKIPRSLDLNQKPPPSNSPDDVSKRRSKKNKKSSRTRKNNLSIDPDELKNVLDDMNEEIDNVLEETAEKNRLTATNVKNILRHVITNEYVLAMVRNTMKAENNEDDLEDVPFEPKLTRSKVKELREKQHMLPWPMSTPVKQVERETQALLEEEFSDECSSDEDYKPNEEECPSEEDIIPSSPKSGDLNSSFLDKSTSTINKEEVDDDVGLVIAIPEAEPEAKEASTENEADNIALRTRSKLPLNDTPLEAIEASFIAPDITMDMYDTHCDDEDWQKFLRELSQPLDKIVAVEKADDPEEDPEYNALEDEDVPDELDMRFDNTVKVTRKELNALMAEIYDFEESIFNDYDEDEEDESGEKNEEEGPTRSETPLSSEVQTDTQINVPIERTGWAMTWEERVQLEQQMRMYVQLLTQSYLLSCGIPELNFLNISSKLFLGSAVTFKSIQRGLCTLLSSFGIQAKDEIKMFASCGDTVNGRSAFHSYNLDGALDIVNDFENDKINLHMRSNYGYRNAPGISIHQVKKIMFSSKVFLYPELLPTCGFSRKVENRKISFTPAEDNLIALGLEEFSFSSSPTYYIRSFLIPNKTEEQIKIRIKNCRSGKSSSDNPVKYYFTHRKAPPFPRTIEFFDPDKVKAPKDHPLEVLPKWATQLFPSGIPPILPKALKPIAPNAVVVKVEPPKRKFRPLLPRKVHYSPLKQISPILKKYNQKRFLPSDHSSKKPIHIVKNSNIKSSAIVPKHVKNLEKMIKKEVLENDNLNSNLSNGHKTENLNIPVRDKAVEKSSPRSCDETLAETNEISKMSDCVVDFNTNECDGPGDLDVTDEGDEEIIDDETETLNQNDSDKSTLVNNAVSKKHSAIKKKNKQQRDLESSLALLQPNLVDEDPKKEEREALFVKSYLLRVTETCDPDTCEKFLRVLGKHQYSTISPVKLYFEIKTILKDYPGLTNDFVGFLNAEQAKECGKYKEYIQLNKIRNFFRKVEVHFKNQSQHLLKILKILAQFRQQCSITSSEVLNILQPMLKNQSHLMEELVALLPDLAPSENLMTDFQEVTIPNSDDDNSSVSSCEEIQIPDLPDPYGGKDCPCECHTSSTEVKVQNKMRHCVNCGVKFLEGRVYIQTGKVLKPAHVVYSKEPPQPVKASNDDSKAPAKNKQSNCSSTVVLEPSTKPEAQSKKDFKSPPSDLPSIVTSDDFSSNKDPTAIPNLVTSSDGLVQPTSKLPCDVIEDTVFPIVPVASNKRSVPPDFSHLKEAIVPTKDSDASPNAKSATDNQKESASQPEENNLNIASNQAVKWTRSEDKFIIYNCQRLGINEEAFRDSAAKLKSKTSEQVQERLLHLLKLLSAELESSSKEIKPDVNSK